MKQDTPGGDLAATDGDLAAACVAHGGRDTVSGDLHTRYASCTVGKYHCVRSCLRVFDATKAITKSCLTRDTVILGTEAFSKHVNYWPLRLWTTTLALHQNGFVWDRLASKERSGEKPSQFFATGRLEKFGSV